IRLRSDDGERLHPLPIWRAPYVPQPRKGERLLRLEMNPHRGLAPSFFPPLIEAVSGNNTAASIDERLEGRQLRQCFGSRVNHSIADTGVCGPMRNQTPLHEPALIASMMTDNHRDVG